MAYDTSWSIDKYKSPFESEEHWELRRNFLVAHKSKYPEDQLVCLAQVFFNIELLGCRYPEETMNLVTELSEGIADTYREQKQQKLQRTFVKASDAAGSRLKGNLAVSTPTLTSSAISTLPKEETISETTFLSKSIEDSLLSKNQEIISVSLSEQFPLNAHKYFKNFVIMKNVDENFFEHGGSILQRSLAKTTISPKFKFEMKGTLDNPTWNCVLSVNETDFAFASAKNKLMSKKAATEILLFKLQDFCFTLEEKKKFVGDGSTIQKNVTNVTSEKDFSEMNVMDSNVGSKIMKMMGWRGGGLGKTEQGISSPVIVQDRIQRSGFGTNLSENELLKKLRHKLDTYAKSNTNYDLVFSNDFSKEERAKLHQIASKLHLKTRSYGKGVDRHLVVSKASDQQSIIETLMNCGGENEKYKLIPPVDF